MSRVAMLFTALGAATSLATTLFAQSAVPGVDKQSILVGVSSPQTGSEASVGKDYVAGARLAFDSVNKSGGVFGRAITLKVMDDAGKAENTASNTRRLVDEGAFALFGYYGGNNTLAAMPTINAAGIPLVGVFTGNQSLRDPRTQTVYHTRAGYYQEISQVAKKIRDMHGGRVAIVHFDDKGGADSGKRAAEELQKLGLEIRTVIPLPRGTVQVEEAAKRLANSETEWVVMILTNTTAAALISRTRELGGHYQFLSLSFTNSSSLIQDLGPKKSTGLVFTQVVPTPFSSTSSKAGAEFRQLALPAGVPVSYVAMEGYIAARVFIEGIKRAGADLTRAKFTQGLDSGKPILVGEYAVSYSPTDKSGGSFVELTVVDRYQQMRN